MIEVSEVLLLESSAVESKQENNNHREWVIRSNKEVNYKSLNMPLFISNFFWHQEVVIPLKIVPITVTAVTTSEIMGNCCESHQHETHIYTPSTEDIEGIVF